MSGCDEIEGPAPGIGRIVHSGGDYNSPAFLAASASLRSLRARIEAMGLGVVGLGVVLRSAPLVTLPISDGPAGREIRAVLRAGSIPLTGGRRLRVAHGVQALPATFEEHLAGGHRRPMRKKISRARALGLRCSRIEPPDRPAVIEALLPTLGGDTHAWTRRTPGEHDLSYLMSHPDGRPVAVAEVTVDREVALLRSLVSSVGDEGQSEARYALHAEVVRQVIARGCTWLCSDSPSALRLSPGLQQFQAQTGYGVAHLLWRDRSGAGADSQHGLAGHRGQRVAGLMGHTEPLGAHSGAGQRPLHHRDPVVRDIESTDRSQRPVTALGPQHVHRRMGVVQRQVGRHEIDAVAFDRSDAGGGAAGGE